MKRIRVVILALLACVGAAVAAMLIDPGSRETLLGLPTDLRAPSAQREPLATAAFQDDLAEVERLLAAGANVNEADPREGFTPLYEAALAGNEEMARYLMAHGARVNRGDPLGAAASRGNVEMASLLLASGARIRQGRRFWRSPRWLHYEDPVRVAAARGDEAMLGLLFDHGADPNLDSGALGPPLLTAVVVGQKEAARVLIARGARINARMGKDEWTPLGAAAEAKDLEMVRLLLDAGADPNLPNGHGETPLGVAASRGSPEVAALLRERGAK
jgi:ankyrin repeat protein